MDVRFIDSVAVISPDTSASRELYVNALGLPLAGEPDGYLHSEDIDGSKSFGVWPLSQAAEACRSESTVQPEAAACGLSVDRRVP